MNMFNLFLKQFAALSVLSTKNHHVDSKIKFSLVGYDISTFVSDMISTCKAIPVE